jgi:hypothetical protein
LLLTYCSLQIMLLKMSRIEKAAGAGCAAVILMHLFASFFPEFRLWGLNYFLYFPPSVRYALSLMGLFFLVPSVNRAAMDCIGGFLERPKDWLLKTNRYLRYALSSLLCVPIFWLLREKTHILGDGALRATEIKKGIRLSPTEPLDVFLHSQAYQLFRSWWNWDEFTTYAFLSCLAGAVFLFFALLLSKEIGQIKKGNLLVFGIVATTGGIQLFFGYVESYSFLYASVIAYLFFCVRYLKGKCSFAVPCLVYLISSSLHVSGFFLLPSLIYLFILKNKKDVNQSEMGFDTQGMAFLFTALFVSIAEIWLLRGMASSNEKVPLTHYLIAPLGRTDVSYTLFSVSHLLDVLNEQLMIFPVGIAVWAAVLLFRRRGAVKTDKVSGFLASVALSFSVFAILVDPKLGYARDWDLFATTGIGYAVWGAYLFVRLLKSEGLKNLNYVTSVVLVSGLLCVTPWVLVNSSAEKSVQRFENLLCLDRERSGYGREILARYYQRTNKYRLAIRQYELAAQIQRHTRYLHEKATLHFTLGEYTEALEAVTQALEIDSSHVETYNSKGVILQAMGSYQEAEQAFKRGLELDPDAYQVHGNLGRLYAKMQRYREALEQLEMYLKLAPHDQAYLWVKHEVQRLRRFLEKRDN